MPIQVEIKTNNTNLAKDCMADAVLDSLDMCGQVIAQDAKEGCPVDTGRLRASITYEIGNQLDYVKIGTDEKSDWYALTIERGDARGKEPSSLPTFVSEGAPQRASTPGGDYFLTGAFKDDMNDVEKMFELMFAQAAKKYGFQ